MALKDELLDRTAFYRLLLGLTSAALLPLIAWLAQLPTWEPRAGLAVGIVVALVVLGIGTIVRLIGTWTDLQGA